MHFKTSQTLVARREEWLHTPWGAVPDVTGLERSPWLAELVTEGLAHFLPVGHQALGSLNLGSQVAARGRTMSPVAKLPESLCRKKRNVTDGRRRRREDGLGTTRPKTTTSCFLVSCPSGSLSSTQRICHQVGWRGPLSHFPLTSSLS